MEFTQGRVWAVRRLSSMVPTNRADASGWEGEECGSQCSLGKRHSVIYYRNSNRCDGETQEDTHMSKVGRRKRKDFISFQRSIVSKNQRIQSRSMNRSSKTKQQEEKVTVHSYSMVKISRVEPGDTTNKLWSKGLGQSER